MRTRDQFKIFFFFICAIICFAQCFTIVRNFLQYPFVIDMYDVSPNLINKLPGLTICNNNRLSLRRLVKRNPLVRDAMTERFPDWVKENKPQIGNYFNYFRDEVARIFQQLNYDPQAELDNSTLNDLFELKPDHSSFLRWLGCARNQYESIECNLLTRIDSVQDRRCATILHRGTMLYDSINNPDYFNASAKSTSQYDTYFAAKEIVRMLVDFEPEDYADLKRQIGARMIFHANNYVASSTELDFYITRGYRYDFNIDREDMLLMEEPYGNCYNYEEANLNAYEDYINPRVPLYGDTCFQNCVIKNVIHIVNCWPPTMPYFRNDSLDPNLDLKSCNWKSREQQHTNMFKYETKDGDSSKQTAATTSTTTTTADGNKQTTNSLKFNSNRDTETEINVEFRNYKKIRRHCWAQCALPCRIVKYSISVTRSKWPSEVRTLFDKTGSDSLLSHCCALITIKNTHLHGHKEQRFLPKYNLADTFGNIGGLLAVWLGLSMVSVYHAVQKLVELCNEKSSSSKIDIIA